MAKNQGHIISWEEMMGKPDEKLNQCPCNPACKCVMDEPCLGCETYGEWLIKEKDNG